MPDKKKQNKWLHQVMEQPYAYGFESPVEADRAPQGLTQETVRYISAAKQEPHWLLEWRLKAFAHWLTMEEPSWAEVKYTPIDYQAQYYYAAPKKKNTYQSLSEADPELLATFEKLGIPLQEQKRLAGVAVDAVFDSVSVGTTFRKELEAQGILFCSFSQAVKDYPHLVREYLGKVVPATDNFFAALNAALFSDGSFCYIPPGVRCPMELSTYFRINAANTGQFERTLIIADEGSEVSYLEGCTAPQRPDHQLHAAVVEIYAAAGAHVRYATVQNWYPGSPEGKGGIYNFVTKRGLCAGLRAHIRWTQVEVGSAITWKYPSCILKGEESVGEFYSVTLTKNKQQADTGTKMIHLAPRTRSRIVVKSISAGESRNTYRGLVRLSSQATDAANFSQCDALLLGDKSFSYTYPYLESQQPTATVAHEAATAQISQEAIYYGGQRGLSEEIITALLVVGHCREVFQHLPMEFAKEAEKLLNLTLEGSVG